LKDALPLRRGASFCERGIYSATASQSQAIAGSIPRSGLSLFGSPPIDEKLKTLDNLHQLLQHDQTNRWMLMLEATIVLLFVMDLVLLFGRLNG